MIKFGFTAPVIDKSVNFYIIIEHMNYVYNINIYYLSNSLFTIFLCSALHSTTLYYLYKYYIYSIF